VKKTPRWDKRETYCDGVYRLEPGLQIEEFAEAFGLLAGDGDFGIFLVVHFEHEAGFEPGDDFLDVVDVHEIGAMRAPEGIGIEGGQEFVEGAVIGRAFDLFGNDGNEPAFDGGENQIGGIDKEHALLRADEDFGGLRGGGLGSGELRDELFEAFSGIGLGFDFAFDALNGFGDAGLVERLENIVDGIHVESLDGVVVESGGEDNVRNFEVAFNEFLEDAEAVETGHLDVEENEIGIVFLDEIDGVEAVFALGQKIDFRKTLEEEREFIARGLFVIDDDGADRHDSGDASSIAWEERSGER